MQHLSKQHHANGTLVPFLIYMLKACCGFADSPTEQSLDQLGIDNMECLIIIGMMV